MLNCVDSLKLAVVGVVTPTETRKCYKSGFFFFFTPPPPTQSLLKERSRGAGEKRWAEESPKELVPKDPNQTSVDLPPDSESADRSSYNSPFPPMLWLPLERPNGFQPLSDGTGLCTVVSAYLLCLNHLVVVLTSYYC